jgi:hypothetical protein
MRAAIAVAYKAQVCFRLAGSLKSFDILICSCFREVSWFLTLHALEMYCLFISFSDLLSVMLCCLRLRKFASSTRGLT